MRDWSTACLDWEDRITHRRSLIPDNIEVFEDEANRALRIFKRLKCPDVEGFPTYGQLCDDWVLDIVRVIFGSYDAEIKRRMIREFFVLVPKKNGKSSIAAAIMVTAAIMNRRPAATEQSGSLQTEFATDRFWRKADVAVVRRTSGGSVQYGSARVPYVGGALVALPVGWLPSAAGCGCRYSHLPVRPRKLRLFLLHHKFSLSA